MNKTNLASFNNSWYKPGGNVLSRFLWYFTNAWFFKSSFPINSIKVILLKLYGAKLGSGVVIKPYASIKYPWKLIVGNNVWIGEQVWIDNLDLVTIENNVCISQGALILCGNHDYRKTTFDLIIQPITLKEGSWVGAKSVVCPGVVLGSHAILSVGSVATRSIEEYAIYQGNPAQKIRDRKME